MRLVGVVASVVLLGAVAPTAQAGQLSILDETWEVWYTAFPGETNRVVARYDAAAGTFTLRDTGAALVIGPLGGFGNASPAQCTYQRQSVTCRHEGPRPDAYINLDLGDGDDSASLTATAGFTQMLGGTGGDALLQNGTAGLLVGGEGHDHLRGGDGDDELFGGPGADRLDGGAGRDAVTYSFVGLSWLNLDWERYDATRGVRVTFDGAPNDGMPGEGDNVLGTVETVWGSGYGDTLVGSENGDTLIGLGGRDRLEGGAGDDVLEIHDGEPDAYTCGDGADSVLADPLDVFDGSEGPDCETTEVLG
jgi:Ca2+-binding RTX toxin-like protein